MITFFQVNAWWLLPAIMYLIKVVIEIFVGQFRSREINLAVGRIGLEFCFLSLGFYGLALIVKSSKFYGDWCEIQGIAAFVFFVALMLLYFVAVLVYKRGGQRIGIWPFRKLKWLLAASVAGVFALVVSLHLF